MRSREEPWADKLKTNTVWICLDLFGSLLVPVITVNYPGLAVTVSPDITCFCGTWEPCRHRQVLGTVERTEQTSSCGYQATSAAKSLRITGCSILDNGIQWTQKLFEMEWLEWDVDVMSFCGTFLCFEDLCFCTSWACKMFASQPQRGQWRNLWALATCPRCGRCEASRKWMEKSALADLATEGSGNDVNDQNHHASATSAHAFACFIGSFRSFSVSGFLWILKDLLGVESGFAPC